MIGLINLGNTCYINCCIQILNNINPLEKILKNNKNNYKNDNHDDIITNEFLNLIEMKYNNDNNDNGNNNNNNNGNNNNNNNGIGNIIISPKRFIYCVNHISVQKKLSFYSNNEGDVVEFLFFIIDCFNNSIKKNRSSSNNISTNIDLNNKYFLKNNIKYIDEKIKEYNYNNKSEIIDLFYGSYLSFIESYKTSEILSLNFQTFMILDLCLINNKNITIYDCFDFFVKKELLNLDNSFYNEKTKAYEKVYKYNKLWNLPNILIVVFNRFDNNNNKLNHIIDSPIENINLNKYIYDKDEDKDKDKDEDKDKDKDKDEDKDKDKDEDKDKDKDNNKYIYDLTSIIYHFGDCMSGHYTCAIKKNNEFYNINDQHIRVAKNIINNNVYSFIYTKK